MKISIMLVNCTFFLLLSQAIFECGVLSASNQSNGQDGEVERLLAILNDQSLKEQDPDSLVKAMHRLADLQATHRLGDFQSTAAINDLVKLLTFKYTYYWEKEAGGRLDPQPITTAERYPAIAALFTIGKPALPAITEVIETHESNSLESENATLVVYLIFRESPSAGTQYLTEASARASTPTAALRLSVAAKQENKLLRHAPGHQ